MTINLHQISSFVKHFLLAKRKGHGIHSPFAYTLCEEVFYNTDSFYDFKLLNQIRSNLFNNENLLEVTDLGAGSKTFNGKQRKIKDIAEKGISSRKQSEILYRLVNYLKCQTCVELGTSLGLNTLYLAMANKSANIITLEGSTALVAIAKRLAEKNKLNNIQFIEGHFDQTFPNLLAQIDKLDLLYADGNHTYEATINYFELALEKKNRDSVFIFDDIYWSQGMTRAWEEIKKHPEVTLSIDTFYMGLVFFKEEIKEKRELKFYL